MRHTIPVSNGFPQESVTHPIDIRYLRYLLRIIITLLERVLFLISKLICSLSRALIVVVVVFIFSSTNLCCTILLSMVRYVESILSTRTKYLVQREKKYFVQNTVVMGA